MGHNAPHDSNTWQGPRNEAVNEYRAPRSSASPKQRVPKSTFHPSIQITAQLCVHYQISKPDRNVTPIHTLRASHERVNQPRARKCGWTLEGSKKMAWFLTPEYLQYRTVPYVNPIPVDYLAIHFTGEESTVPCCIVIPYGRLQSSITRSPRELHRSIKARII